MPLSARAADLKAIDPDSSTGVSAAVVVPTAAGLIQTSQLLPLGPDGAVQGGDNAGTQFDVALGHLKSVLAQAGSGLDRLGRVHVCVAHDDAVPAVRKAFASAFAELPKPAATFVVTPLPHPKALVGLDAVAASAKPVTAIVRARVAGVPGPEKLPHFVAFPSASVVFISGQAEPGSLPEATRKTMQSLHDTLKFLGLDATQVVQVKTFLKPMADAAVAEKEIASFYADGAAPAVTHVEWTYGSPIEIELVAVGKSSPPPADPVRFLAPPHLKHSPVFSRIVVAEGKSLVFVSGLSGSGGSSGETQVQAVFERLQTVLGRAGSDLKHLAKATYYVSQDDPSNALNALRPKYYDPMRPPAASKAGVKGVATPGVGLVVDMIAAGRE